MAGCALVRHVCNYCLLTVHSYTLAESKELFRSDLGRGELLLQVGCECNEVAMLILHKGRVRHLLLPFVGCLIKVVYELGED